MRASPGTVRSHGRRNGCRPENLLISLVSYIASWPGPVSPVQKSFV